MFEDVDILKALGETVYIMSFLVAGIGALFILSYFGYIELSLSSFPLAYVIIGFAALFNLVFAFALLDQSE